MSAPDFSPKKPEFSPEEDNAKQHDRDTSLRARKAELKTDASVDVSEQEDDPKQLMSDSSVDVRDQKRAGSLLLAERRTLEMIAEGASLTDVLEDLCAAIDAQSPEIMSTIMLMDPDGKRLWSTAGSRVPEAWLRAITPLTIGPSVGSCGTAAFLKKLVIVSDIAADPLWSETPGSDYPEMDYREMALSHGLRAAWSKPIISKDGEVLGTFAMYYARPHSPTDSELQLIDDAGHIARIAIERERAQRALAKALDDINKSEGQLRKIIDTIPTLAWRCRPDGAVEFLNQRWLDYTGLSQEEALGWGWKASIHPDDRERLMDTWQRQLGSGEPG